MDVTITASELSELLAANVVLEPVLILKNLGEEQRTKEADCFRILRVLFKHGGLSRLLSKRNC
jgi:hypothetical protein